MSVTANNLPEFISLVRKFESDDSLLKAAFWALIARDPDAIFVMDQKPYFKTSPYLDGCALGYRGVHEADYNIISGFAKQGKKVEAIKHLRGVTGSGLTEAKNAVESWFEFRHY